MEEARYRPLFLAMIVVMLMIEVKCPCLRAKSAHLVGHLPAESQTRGAKRVIIKEAPRLRKRGFLIAEEEAVRRNMQNARRPGFLERRFGGSFSQERRRSRQRGFDRQGFAPCARPSFRILYFPLATVS